MLKFSEANTKIKGLKKVSSIQPFLQNRKKVYSFDLLSGWSCPFAEQCFSKVVESDKGKRTILDGKKTKFRCFSASQEVVFPSLYNLRKHNFDMLLYYKSKSEMQKIIQLSMPNDIGVCRIHVGGDFFNQDYFDAWVDISVNNPEVLFYGYTKSLRYWLRYAYVPSNFILTASRGGRQDNLIDMHNLRESIVVFTEQEAIDKGLEIDHDDSHAADPSKSKISFALLLHGTQPKGSEASSALSALKGKGSYSKKAGAR